MAVLRSPRLWLTLVSLAAVLWILQRDLGARTSPGELGATHLALAELDGAEGCDTCHGEGPADLARACTECHGEVGDELREGVGFHGSLALAAGAAQPAEVPAEDCGACHLEHHGSDFPPVSERSFELAGFVGRTGFDHGRLDYLLEGEHADLGCEACHLLADAPALVEGERRFGGLTRSCAPCHEDPHEDRMARACDSCHGPAEAWHDLGPFEHDPAFPLTGAHALAALEASTTAEACVACHEPGAGHGIEGLAALGPGALGPDVLRGCAACHEDPHDPAFLAALEDASGPADGLVEDDSCAACHAPHPDGFGPASLAAGLLEDPADAAALHAATGFALAMPHADLACEACHADPTALVPVEGRTADPAPLAGAAFAVRFPGRAADDCAACHSDPHAGANGPSCTDCHAAAGPWSDLSAFDHRADFPLAGVHGQLACAACHAESGPTSVADLDRRSTALDVPPTRTCVSCHEQDHDPAFLAGVAELLPASDRWGALLLDGGGSGPEDTCSACHDPRQEPVVRGGPGFRAAAEALPVDLHAASGFALEAPHADLACAACHADPTLLVPPGGRAADPSAPAGATFAARFHPAPEARAAADCAACHRDPHDGHLAASPLVAAAGVDPDPSGCRACHADTAFIPSRVDTALHAASGFPLEGAHDAVGCYACHEREPGRTAARFADTPRTCEACHADVHAGAFAALEVADLELTAAERSGHAEAGTCAACHTTTDFHAVAAVAEERFDHDAWCGFALEGAHAEAACEACHAPEPPGPGARRFGRVAVLFPGDTGRCATCHADPHGGAFDAGPASVDGAVGCARCHDQESFRMSGPAPFDHDLWTGFGLVGPHAAADCAACHGRDAAPNGGSPLGAAAGTACAACHGDVHLGQFREQDAATTACDRCHQVPADPAAGWRADSFDHDAAFALDATHASLDCAACHRPWPLPDGGAVVRYRPLGRTCEACHGSPVPGGGR